MQMRGAESGERNALVTIHSNRTARAWSFAKLWTVQYVEKVCVL